MHSRIDSLTGIRALAALWIVVYHLWQHNYEFPHYSWGLLEPLVQKGPLGVDAFFVLSGYVLTMVHRKDFPRWSWPKALHFWGLRLARMYPVHVFMILVYGAMLFVSAAVLHSPPKHVEQFTMPLLGLNVLLVHAWGFAKTFSWNSPSWSISLEWFAYLTFPAGMIALRNLHQHRAGLIGLIILLVVLLHQTAINYPPNYEVTFPSSLLTIFSEFYIGYAVYSLSQLVKIPERWTDWLAFGCLGLVVALAVMGMPKAVAVLCIASFFLVLGQSRGLVSRVLGSTPLVFLGDISYSVYMNNIFIIWLFNKFMPKLLNVQALNPLQCFGIIGLELLVIIGSAYLMYRWIETPIRQWCRRWLDSQLVYRLNPKKEMPAHDIAA